MSLTWDRVLQLDEDWSDVERWHAGRMLLMDKPMDWTSFDLVGKCKVGLKYKLGIKKIKFGHAGTLDPKATGLMILLAGKHTKLTDQLHTLEKEYIAEIFLGATTPCYDTERPIDQYFPTEHINDEMIYQTIEKFKGSIEQLPPIYSAVKIDGRSAYKSAHKGKEIATRPRLVTIHELEVLKIEMPILKLRIKCSSGTYIRSLAHDIGKAMNSGGYLHSLVRTQIGEWKLEEAMSIDDFWEKLETYSIQSTIV